MPPEGASNLSVYYYDFDSTLGCFVNDPQTGPFLMLRSGLDKRTEAAVHRQLKDYHEGLPGDSPYFLFRHVAFFEDMVPPEALPVPDESVREEVEEEEEVHLILIGRAIRRRWRFVYPMGGEQSRVIGKAG